mmetsp:Transcript_8821/g.31346  ORF Transcript_8821/g.31346 Transcript_8821/m.31346 type:complete len:173 (+) Transcript_8821:832-1350(+)
MVSLSLVGAVAATWKCSAFLLHGIILTFGRRRSRLTCGGNPLSLARALGPLPASVPEGGISPPSPRARRCLAEVVEKDVVAVWELQGDGVMADWEFQEVAMADWEFQELYRGLRASCLSRLKFDPVGVRGLSWLCAGVRWHSVCSSPVACLGGFGGPWPCWATSVRALHLRK